MIDAIDNFYKNERPLEKTMVIDQYDRYYNPVAEIITPEWFYSDSYRVFNNAPLTWEKLDKPKLINTMVMDLDKKNYGAFGKEFEKDFCCWYQSYHYLPREKWGIHLRYDGVLAVASDINKRSKAKSKPHDEHDCVKHALLYLYTHCIFHSLLENAVSLMEIVSDNDSMYGNYVSKLYVETFNTSNCIEEALANAFTLELADELRLSKRYLKHKLYRQGDGYKDFIYFSGKNLQKGKRLLLSQIKHCNLNPPLDKPLEFILDIPFTKTSSLENYAIPVWLHHSAKSMHHRKNHVAKK